MAKKKCALCGITEEDTTLYEGIYDREMIFVCQNCAREERIPIIRKPSIEQLKDINKFDSVRERMERMSGMKRIRTNIGEDQQIVLRNLTKLRIPEPKQKHEDVEDNYYWELNMARRRKKITTNQLAKETGISLEIIENLEKGKLPIDFKEILSRLEEYFNLKLLRHHDPKINFIVKENENKILEDVKQKIKEDREEVFKRRRKKILKKIENSEIDFSKQEDLKNITLNDLIKIKKRKEKEEQRKKYESQRKDLFGDDLELDEN
ncbi:MAG: helix-turn-helix transcriptional regulator [Candidatus Pacearchaeota archaeon]